MRMFKKIKRDATLLTKAFFWGMKGADEMTTTSQIAPNEIVQEKMGGGVFQDMLQNKETQQVKETRDAYYRILKEADKYQVTLTGFQKDTTGIDDELIQGAGIAKLTTSGEVAADEVGDIITATAVKKNNLLERSMEGILQTKGYKVEVIQDRKTYENDRDTQMKEAALGVEINDPRFEIFTIERDFCPRFSIEFLIQKLVIKKTPKGTKRIIDLYFSIYPRQFRKTDALFIAEMKRILENPEYKTDIFDFNTIQFITDKSYGVDSLHEFKFERKKLRDIKINDGNYVVSFDVETLVDQDVTEKFKTKELDEKYATNAPKHDATDINTILRHQ